jgi:hypothetical protein
MQLHAQEIPEDFQDRAKAHAMGDPAVRRKCQTQRVAGGRPFGSAFFLVATTSG